MLKILYITDYLRQRFGVTNVILNYIEHFPMQQIKVDVLCYEGSEEAPIKRLESCGCKVFFMPVLGMRSIRQFKCHIESFFKNNNYDVVHSHFNQIDGIVFPIARKNGSCVCISHSHNTKLAQTRLKEIRNRIMCFNISENADYWAACSDDAGVALFGKSYPDSQKRILIKNGIECSNFVFSSSERTKIRLDLGVHDDELLLGTVGSFKPQKNHIFLLELFCELFRRNENYKLLLVGDGELRPLYEKFIDSKGLTDRVIMTGVRNDVNLILNALDVFILPSIFEGLGVSAIEAQANGLKCIVSSAVPKEAMVTDNIVFLSLEKSVLVWCKCIEHLSSYKRVDLANEVARQGYDINSAASILENTYVKIVNQSLNR